ncbi:MAG: hypothetical protein QM715_18960 [Nibricoccus sp.]
MKPPSIADTVSLVGIAGAGIACVSLAYEYGFASGAGVSLTVLSLNPHDLIKSASAWAPPLFVGFAGIFFLETSTSYIEGGRSEDEIVRQTGNPELWRKIRRSPDYMFLVIGLLLLIAIVANAEFIRPFVHNLYVLVWLSVAGFLVTRDSLQKKFPPRLLFAVWAIVGVVLFVYGSGKQDAITASSKKGVDTVELASGKVSAGRLLRRYSEFVLFLPDTEKDTVIIPASEVRLIKKPTN